MIEKLLEKGDAIRALVRARENKTSLPAGVEPVFGELADVESLRSAMLGADRVFLLCGPAEDEVRLNRNAIDVAAQAGIRLLVRSSILGSDPSSQATFVRDHGACDAYLDQSGVPRFLSD